MSDISTGDPVAPPMGTPSEPTSTPAPSTPSALPDGDLLASPLGAEEPFVSRGYAEKLRAEGFKYRTDLRATQENLNRYEAIFGDYQDADRDVWFDLANTWKSDPTRAAAMMRAIADAVQADGTPDEQQATAEAVETGAATGLLTPEQVQAMIDAKLGERDTQAQEDRMVNQVLTEVRGEGFDPDSIEGFMVLWTASNQTGGDVKAAAQKMRDYKQSIIDGYVQGRANGQRPTPSAPGTAATEAPAGPGSWDDVRKGATKFMEAASGNGLP
jgi:hypothetical protein